MMFINDQESYVFKVAAFNEWGNKGYKTSDVYKGEGMNSCVNALSSS
jgi:hypothetical protein